MFVFTLRQYVRYNPVNSGPQIPLFLLALYERLLSFHHVTNKSSERCLQNVLKVSQNLDFAVVLKTYKNSVNYSELFSFVDFFV